MLKDLFRSKEEEELINSILREGMAKNKDWMDILEEVREINRDFSDALFGVVARNKIMAEMLERLI